MSNANASESFDAFAELGVPRQVDPGDEQIEDAWRELSRRLHPDSPDGDPARSAAVNRAHEILAQPGTRLRHWLELNGRTARNAAMSKDTMSLFSKVGTVLQAADEVLMKRAAATTAMGKAVLAAREWQVQADLQKLLGEITAAIGTEIDRFTEIDEKNFTLGESTAAALGFLEKWQAQIRERLLALMAD
jgi:hypothetical protein